METMQKAPGRLREDMTLRDLRPEVRLRILQLTRPVASKAGTVLDSES